jgi:hypothetical protein
MDASGPSLHPSSLDRPFGRSVPVGLDSTRGIGGENRDPMLAESAALVHVANTERWYLALHRAVWPEVEAALLAGHVRGRVPP